MGSMRGSMRLTGCFVLALGVAVAASTAQAQDYPVRPVRIVVGFGSGAVADVLARVLAARMSQGLGQQVVVENRAGAGSNLAAEYVTRAPKDGYTLLMATVANSINAVVSDLAFDFGRDLAPISLLGVSPHVFVVHPSVGVNTLPEFIALAKAKPDQLFYGHSGVGTLGHLSGQLLNALAGVKLMHVPYNSSAQGVNDMLAGRITAMFSPAPTVWPHVEAGKLKALATTGSARAAFAPDLPTMAESGVPGFSTGVWMGLLAPAGTQREVLDKLARAANEALKSDDVSKPMRTQGIELRGGGPEEFARHIQNESRNWTQAATLAGIKPRAAEKER